MTDTMTTLTQTDEHIGQTTETRELRILAAALLYTARHTGTMESAYTKDVYTDLVSVVEAMVLLSERIDAERAARLERTAGVMDK